MDCITSVTPTICKLMGIPPPSLSDQKILRNVIHNAKDNFNITRIDRCLVYAPDAMGSSLTNRYTSSFEKVAQHARLRVPLSSVFPPKTPVCFASMFTGALPEVHGIRKYERPVLRCDTIFDAMIRAYKRIAIVAVKDSSVDLIFRNRKLDYFSENYDEEVTDRTLSLLESGGHDFILSYHQEYDDALHETTPQSPEAIHAMENHIKNFDKIAVAFASHWRNYNRVILFAPDHGSHIDPETGKGTHGENIPEDMLVQHFFGFGTGDGKYLHKR